MSALRVKPYLTRRFNPQSELIWCSAVVVMHHHCDTSSPCLHVNSAENCPEDTESQRQEHYVPGRWKYAYSQRKLTLPCYLYETSTTLKDFFGRQSVLAAIEKTLVVPEGMDIMSELKTFAIYGIGGIGTPCSRLLIK
jgi:hypothetical protein